MVFASFVFFTGCRYNMILIIAYGNTLRQDDGAGRQLAERLASAWQSRLQPVELCAVQQLTPEIAAEIARAGIAAVVFVDTRVSTSPADRSVTIAPVEPATDSSPSMGHHCLPGVLLAYAQALFTADALPPAWLVTAPGVRFGYGEALSSVAQEAIRAAFDDANHPLARLIDSLATESAF